MRKKANAAIVDLNNRAGGLLIAKTVNGQKRYQWRRDLPTPLQLELNCLRRNAKKRLNDFKNLIVLARQNNYHIRQKLSPYDYGFHLRRAVRVVLIHAIKSLAALNSLQIISRFTTFLLEQFKIIETINKQKPRELKLYEAF